MQAQAWFAHNALSVKQGRSKTNPVPAVVRPAGQARFKSLAVKRAVINAQELEAARQPILLSLARIFRFLKKATVTVMTLLKAITPWTASVSCLVQLDRSVVVEGNQ